MHNYLSICIRQLCDPEDFFLLPRYVTRLVTDNLSR